MNWPRGLFRLWVGASAIWLLCVGVIGVVSLVAKHWALSIADAGLFAAYVVIPPLAVVALGLLGLWIARGFNGK
jgi:hypothetical protein